MAHLILEADISRYSAAPAPTTVDAAVSLHNNIRDTLGSGYETFLQGSYKNDTGIVDINDVDIVALRKQTTSTHFTGTVARYPITWDEIFQEIQSKLEGSYHYRGKTERSDKCITVNTNFKADVVPAIFISSDGLDPISIYSFRGLSERKNFPRVHYYNNIQKHARTSKVYKSLVRMFKRWTKNWFPHKKIAPSFYIECLIYNVPDENFVSDRAVSLSLIGNYIINNYTRNSIIMSVANDKDILTNQEWNPDNFEVFQTQLKASVSKIDRALKATSLVEARRLWLEAFNE
ncbi:nucleotidyltransferase [Herpetosiphon giganteus]|uniref:nucleotidyltransferase domain-containing protein n=1 Tax=Herpetosiphon giganteus TaxID=2029754 RepID=UPI00195DC6A3|nr:nucleotidyltransferase [Herpetosiphon giganteus]MBM7846745.1 hypothetical protein [Herpetosiphon giganteus]